MRGVSGGQRKSLLRQWNLAESITSVLRWTNIRSGFNNRSKDRSDATKHCRGTKHMQTLKLLCPKIYSHWLFYLLLRMARQWWLQHISHLVDSSSSLITYCWMKEFIILQKSFRTNGLFLLNWMFSFYSHEPSRISYWSCKWKCEWQIIPYKIQG